METIKKINTDELRAWLEAGKEVSILDIRPMSERLTCNIPGSIHTDVYEKVRENDRSAFNKIYLDKSIPVVTFCTGGKSSLVAADILSQNGYDAYSLSEGIKGWENSKINLPGSAIAEISKTVPSA